MSLIIIQHLYIYIDSGSAHKDILGNIRQIVDKDSNLVVSYYYDGWGNIYPQYHSYALNFAGTTYSAQDISNLNGLFYKGYYYDKETKLYYLTTRYYDPEIGRFISADDPQYLDFEVAYGYNRYAYCCNNPVMGYDPEGNFPWFYVAAAFVGAVVGAISAAATEVVKQQQNGGALDAAKIWKAVVVGAVTGSVTSLLTLATGSVELGSYAGATAGSTVEEIWEYAAGEKEFTAENLLKSFIEINVDTLIDGSINYVGNKVASLDPSMGPNQQTFVAGTISTPISIIKEGLMERLNRDIDKMKKMYS